jgi:hypothetical protein
VALDPIVQSSGRVDMFLAMADRPRWSDYDYASYEGYALFTACWTLAALVYFFLASYFTKIANSYWTVVLEGLTMIFLLCSFIPAVVMRVGDTMVVVGVFGWLEWCVASSISLPRHPTCPYLKVC